jgi:hypothetical protein
MTVQALQLFLIPLDVQAGPAEALKENALWGLSSVSSSELVFLAILGL